MSQLIIGIAGEIGAGKTAFVGKLAEALNAHTVVSFGDYVRGIAKARELPPDRSILQTLGEELLRARGAYGFAADVIGMPCLPAPSVVDGVRHVEVADAIQDLVKPNLFVLIFLSASERQRRERLSSVRPEDAQRLAEYATHSTERQASSGALRDRADFVVDGSQELAGAVEKVLKFLNAKLARVDRSRNDP